jgi:hypothetical protein
VLDRTGSLRTVIDVPDPRDGARAQREELKPRIVAALRQSAA